MNDLVAALNHLLAAWLAGEAARERAGESPGAPFALRELNLEPDGFRLVAGSGRGAAAGDWVLRGRIEPERGDRQLLHLACERAPERLPELLAALRPLLESARLTLELDFRGAAAEA